MNFDKAMRIIREQDAVFTAQSFAVPHKHILVPVIQRTSTNQGEGKNTRCNRRKPGLRDSSKFERPLVIWVCKKESSSQGMIIRAGPLPAILPGKILVACPAVERNGSANFFHNFGGRLVVPIDT